MSECHSNCVLFQKERERIWIEITQKNKKKDKQGNERNQKYPKTAKNKI